MKNKTCKHKNKVFQILKNSGAGSLYKGFTIEGFTYIVLTICADCGKVIKNILIK